MVADAVIYHPTVSHYLKFIATTVGRDKVLRTIQYFARFYAWYLYRTNHSASSVAAFDTLKKQFGIVRKVMRAGKFVEHYKAAAIAADAKGMDPVLKYCAVGRQLGYAGYLTFDNLTLLDTLGVRKSAATARLSKEASRAWLMGLTFNTIAGVYTLYHLRLRLQSLNKQEAESAVEGKKLEREWNATTLQLISDLCDITIPSTVLGLANFDDGFVGLAGTLSSLLGVFTVWKKTA